MQPRHSQLVFFNLYAVIKVYHSVFIFGFGFIRRHSFMWKYMYMYTSFWKIWKNTKPTVWNSSGIARWYHQKYTLHTKMKFFINSFFSKCDQIYSYLRILSHLLKKSLIKNFSFCAGITWNTSTKVED